MSGPSFQDPLIARIDDVRRSRKDLSSQLQTIATEIPGHGARTRLTKLGKAIDQDVSTADIVRSYPDHCWLLTLQSSAATTDALTAMLEQSAYQHRMSAQRLSSIAYPTVLLAIASILCLAALAFLIPPFDEMYQEFGIRLPMPTLLLIGLSRFVTGHPMLVTGIVVLMLLGLITLLWMWISDSPMKRALFGGSIDLPSQRQSLAKVSLQLAELCDDGFALDSALKIASQSTSDAVMKNLLADLALHASADGKQLNRARAASILPPNFIFALQPSDSGSGSADSSPNTTMLRELASNYRELSVRRREWTSFLFAQFVVIGVGLLIGFMVVALFMPLVSLVSALA